MKVVFLAGPYRASTVNGIWEHVQAARGVAVQLWQMGACVVCPHLNTAMMDGACSDEVWLTGAQELLRRCDGVVLLPRWKDSAGSTAEWRLAKDLRMPHFRWTVANDQAWLQRWLKGTEDAAVLRWCFRDEGKGKR